MASLTFAIAMLLIFAACVGFTFGEGLWSNAVRLINVVTAAILAMSFFEPVAKFLDESVGDSYTYFWDFIALWGLFAAFVVIFRVATDTMSRVKVRFMTIVDRIGSVVLAVLVGWFMLGFAMTTLHTAPLAENFWQGAFDYNSEMLLVGPDRRWIVFFTYLSGGAFSRSLAENEFDAYRADPSHPVAEFDRDHTFMSRYAERRKAVQGLADSGSFRTTSPPKR
jgi:hypothetical protein